MGTLGKLLPVAVVSLFALASAHAQISNGGFETGSFSPWTTTGTAAVTGTFSGQMPNEGNFQAAITTPTSGTVLQPALETFLGLTSGTLNSLNTGSFARGGSAIAQTFTVPAGGAIQFAWDFFPNGSNATSGQNDKVFFTLHLSASSSSSFTILDQTSNHPGGGASGYSLFTTGPLAAGTYILGFAAYDLSTSNFPTADAQDPSLLIDHVSIVPEPATLTLLSLGAIAGGAYWLRRRRS